MPGALLFQPDPIMIRSARGMAAPAQDTVADEIERRWTCAKVSSSFMQRPGRGASSHSFSCIKRLAEAGRNKCSARFHAWKMFL